MKESMDRDSKTKVTARKSYSKPQLVRYGSVTDLTKGSGLTTADGIGIKRTGG